jgi:hypothetical protein
LVPATCTVVPTPPLLGESELIVGAETPDTTLKLLVLSAVPPAVVTAIFPLVAPDATVNVSDVGDATENAPEVPLSFTEVAPVS